MRRRAPAHARPTRWCGQLRRHPRRGVDAGAVARTTALVGRELARADAFLSASSRGGDARARLIAAELSDSHPVTMDGTVFAAGEGLERALSRDLMRLH